MTFGIFNSPRQVPLSQERRRRGKHLLGCRHRRLEREAASWSPVPLLCIFLPAVAARTWGAPLLVGLEERCHRWPVASGGAVDWWWLVGEKEKVGSGEGWVSCDLQMKGNGGKVRFCIWERKGKEKNKKRKRPNNVVLVYTHTRATPRSTRAAPRHIYFFFDKKIIGYVSRRIQGVPVPGTHLMRVLFQKPHTRASEMMALWRKPQIVAAHKLEAMNSGSIQTQKPWTAMIHEHKSNERQWCYHCKGKREFEGNMVFYSK